jgi:RNA polymerase sigma-70 factor (ECF subfamily)
VLVDGRERFEALYRAHVGAVAGYVRRRSDAQIADDVVADVFVVVWRRLSDVPDDPLPWLLGVARRMLANRRRSSGRDAALRSKLTSVVAAADPTPEPPTGASAAVLDALSRLSERDRETLLLIAWEGLSTAQAARVLGVRPNTFAARRSRARQRFARALQDSTRQSGCVSGSLGSEVL